MHGGFRDPECSNAQPFLALKHRTEIKMDPSFRWDDDSFFLARWDAFPCRLAKDFLMSTNGNRSQTIAGAASRLASPRYDVQNL